VARGVQSRIEVAPIIALSGASKINLFDVIPSVTKGKLLRRDRHTCAYCAEVFHERDLQCEHVLPESRGGPWTWTNLVSACAVCNNRKAARTPEEAGMPLVYPAVRAEPIRELSARRPQHSCGRARVAV
jgi:5-methylcytosine-specific restriction endonuclease McrA